MKRDLFIDFAATESFPEVDYYLKLVLRRAILATLNYERFPYPARVSVTLCGREYIHALNKKFRGVDKPTDVLSFPLYDGDFTGAEVFGEAELGDIVISIPRAKEQAVELSNSFLREVAFLAVHSTLHLLGYDHERSKADDEEQCRRQREIIEKVEI